MVFTKKKMMENDNLFRGCEKVKGSTFKLLYDWISKRNLMHFMMGYNRRIVSPTYDLGMHCLGMIIQALMHQI